MRLSAQACLLLDIHNAGFADIGCCRNTGRIPKGIIAHIQNGKPVNLPDFRPFGINHNDVFFEHFVQLFFIQLHPLFLFVNGFLNMCRRHKLRSFQLCPCYRFAENLRQMIEARGKLILPLCRSGGVFHNSANRAYIKFHAPLSIHKPFDKLRDFPDIFICTRHFIIKVRANFEELIKFLVIFIQQLIIIAAANHNHLDICRNRLRLQGGRNHRTQLLPYGVHVDFSGLHHAAECLPCLWRRKDILRLHQQVTAIRLMEQTALNLHEIRCQIPEFAVIFHLTHQIIIGRVKRHHDGRTLAVGMVYNQIDLIFQRHILGRLFPKHRQETCKAVLAILFLLNELADIFQNILLHRIDVGNNSFIFLIFFLHRIHMMPDGKHSRFIIQLIGLPLGFLIHIAQLTHNGACFFLHHLRIFLNFIFYILAQVIVFILANCLALYHWHEKYACIRCFYLKAVLLRNGTHFCHKRISLFIKGMLQSVFLCFVILRTERLLQLRFEKLHQLCHVLLELLALSRLEAQCQRASGVLKVIDIAPVIRHRLCLCQLFGTVSCIGGFACAGRPCHINIVALHFYCQAEIKCLHGSFLPDDPLQRLDLRRCAKGQFLRKAPFF